MFKSNTITDKIVIAQIKVMDGCNIFPGFTNSITFLNFSRSDSTNRTNFLDVNKGIKFVLAAVLTSPPHVYPLPPPFRFSFDPKLRRERVGSEKLKDLVANGVIFPLINAFKCFSPTGRNSFDFGFGRSASRTRSAEGA